MIAPAFTELHTLRPYSPFHLLINIIQLDQPRQLRALIRIIQRRRPRDLIPHPLHILIAIHLRATIEHPRLTARLLKHIAIRLLIRLLQLHQLIRTHAHDPPARIIEAIEIQLSGMIRDIQRHDVAMLRFGMELVAALAAPPGPGLVFNDLLVAAFGAAGWVGGAVLLDVEDRGAHAEVVRVFAHA